MLFLILNLRARNKIKIIFVWHETVLKWKHQIFPVYWSADLINIISRQDQNKIRIFTLLSIYIHCTPCTSIGQSIKKRFCSTETKLVYLNKNLFGSQSLAKFFFVKTLPKLLVFKILCFINLRPLGLFATANYLPRV